MAARLAGRSRCEITRLCVAIMLAVLVPVDAASAQTTEDRIPVGRFSEGVVTGWESRSIQGETRYALVVDPETTTRVLQAEADASASATFRRMHVDLTRTPFLNWSWKVTGTFAGIDETSKAGHDLPARVYVVVERGVFGLSSLSLNYVWASQQPIDRLWPSPFTDQIVLLAVDSGVQDLNEWVHHKRDVRADLNEVFGEDITEIDAVALMTDADNHGGRAMSFYGDIWFSAE